MNTHEISRNQEIYEMWKLERRTMAAIARHFGLTRERVRQIIRRHERRQIDVSDFRTARNWEDDYPS